MQNKYPQKPGIDFILKQAFFYWNKTLVFQLMFSVIYFGIFIAIFFLCDAKYGILAEMNEVSKYMQQGMKVYMEELNKVTATANYQNFALWIMGTSIFLYPLNIGFYEIYRKIDINEKPEFVDLFVGYRGLNFLNIFPIISFGILFSNLQRQRLFLPLPGYLLQFLRHR